MSEPMSEIISDKMPDDPLDAILERLSGGDDAAAEHVFRTFEPSLRLLVRRMLPPPLRSKFDSVDVVQSVWADLLEGFRKADFKFTSAAQLRAFLIKVTRNRFIDKVRKNRTAQEHQRSLDVFPADELPGDDEASPSEMVQADELWQRMMQLCPPAHRELLRLKREGHPLAEIAARTGLHESSVRRILYDLARKLAAEE
jgi:RNA polymerase sigma factor (sigma-70 family)